MPEFVEVNAFRETIRILEDQIKAMAPGSVIVAGFEPLITAGAAEFPEHRLERRPSRGPKPQPDHRSGQPDDHPDRRPDAFGLV